MDKKNSGRPFSRRKFIQRGAGGVAGALVPIGLKKAGADPATASSIFLTTATDVVSMGLLLGFATIFLL